MILLWVTISLHDKSKDTFGFYPLEIFLSLFIIFVLVYFFRVISISTDEIRMHGLFSSKDKILLKKDQTLVIGLLPHRKMRIEVWAGLGDNNIYSWMNNENSENHEISYFRERAVGGASSAKKILKFFGISEKDAESAVTEVGFCAETENVSLVTEEKNEVFEIRLKFKKTLV